MNRDEMRAFLANHVATGGFERRSMSATGLEVREVGGSTLSICGWASVTEREYDMGGAYTEIVRRGAFTKTLSERCDCQLLINHTSEPLARTKSGTLRLSEDATGLRFDADLDGNDPDAARLVGKVQRGDLSECSMAFRVRAQKWSDDYDLRELLDVNLDRDAP